MKFSTTLFTAVAPLAMARRVANVFPPPAGIVGRSVVEVETNGESGESGKGGKGGEGGVEVLKGMKGEGISANSRTEVIVIWVNPGNGASKTNINDQVTVTKTVTAGAGTGGGEATGAPGAPGGSASASAPGSAATHTVKVGGEGLTYKPDQLQNVPVGDMVVFEFLSQNHTVTQSPFDTPCKAMPGGMDSGFLANPNNTVSPPPQVAMQVMTDKPLWFYCRQKTHCGKGMVFSINPTAEKTQAMFQGLAISQNGTGSATPITGGQQSGTPPPPSQSGTAPGGIGGNSTEGVGSGGGSGATPGQGTVGPDGSCQCVVSCSNGAFPAAAQGVGSFGGMSGSLPIKMGSMK